jgi:predicted Zn-dependent protease
MTRAGLVQRSLLVLCAAVAVAWLAVSLHDARQIERAKAFSLERDAGPARVEEAIRLLRGAGRLNPDYTERAVLLASFEARAGHPDRARRILEEVVRREPENRGAWRILASFTRRSDPARSAEARARARALGR